jgi:hypothetical protein
MAGPAARFQTSSGERAVHDERPAFLNGCALHGQLTRNMGGSLRQPVYVPDRAALADAAELIDRFGDFACSEAKLRADRSRGLGNVIHFCRWRQVERTIEMLQDEGGTGLIH